MSTDVLLPNLKYLAIQRTYADVLGSCFSPLTGIEHVRGDSPTAFTFTEHVIDVAPNLSTLDVLGSELGEWSSLRCSSCRFASLAVC